MHKETLLATLGCTPHEHRGAVNTPVYRASTILFETLDQFEAAERGEAPYPTYGRYGTRTTDELEKTIAVLEDADHAIATSSGLAAIAVSLMAFLKSGDHLLMVDNTYAPCRRLCDYELKRFGIETTYYDPAIGAGISALIKENTKVVYIESPGSLTFEMQDIPAIAKAAHARGCMVIGDNTWATPLFMKPFELGIDISIQSATKYMSGHSDLVMGTIACKKEHYTPLLRTFRAMGCCPSGDNCYLVQRGLRSMAARLEMQQAHGLEIAQWLARRPEVEAVLHPALPGAPGHDLWKRDMSGACSLFSIALRNPVPHKALAAMLDHMQLFGMGYSWGGYESLLIPFDLRKVRTATKWPYGGPGLRIHIGLEHPDDLIRDLEAGFTRMKNAA